MEKMTWTWIAGFFEGEGTVFWQEGKKGTKQGLHGRATIGQKDKMALQEIYKFLISEGFSKPSFYLRPPIKFPTGLGLTCEIWILTINKRDDVIRFYAEITPYLFQKYDKAKYVLDRLVKARNERDEILKESIRLKDGGMTWANISRELGIGRVAILNYARSAGTDLHAKYHDEGIDFRQDRVNRGLCETCGKERGESGTKRKCRNCADSYNVYRASRRSVQS